MGRVKKEDNLLIKKLVFLVLSLIIVLGATFLISYGRAAFSVNPKLFFGLFGNNSIALFISSITICLITFIYFFRLKESLFSVSLIVAGGLYNIVERVMRGGNRDYLTFWVIPTFNVADVLIVLGATVFFFKLIKKALR